MMYTRLITYVAPAATQYPLAFGNVNLPCARDTSQDSGYVGMDVESAMGADSSSHDSALNSDADVGADAALGLDKDVIAVSIGDSKGDDSIDGADNNGNVHNCANVENNANPETTCSREDSDIDAKIWDLIAEDDDNPRATRSANASSCDSDTNSHNPPDRTAERGRRTGSSAQQGGDNLQRKFICALFLSSY